MRSFISTKLCSYEANADIIAEFNLAIFSILRFFNANVDFHQFLSDWLFSEVLTIHMMKCDEN